MFLCLVISSIISGKFGQKQKRICRKYVKEFAELQALIDDPNVSISDIYVIGEKLNLVTYSKKEGSEMGMINLVMALQTTSYARIHLWRKLNALHEAGCRILYCGNCNYS